MYGTISPQLLCVEHYELRQQQPKHRRTPCRTPQMVLRPGENAQQRTE